MKWTIYIFSFWLLLLTGLPCPDADCHAHENVTTSTSASHSAEQDHEHGHKAPCSPFCHCTTCVGFSIPRLFHYVAPSATSTRIASDQLFTYQSPSHADVAQAIWQPPKL
ncbi:DUF6660 family protein [Spirosoma sp.]|uniref:DUF6660 family protein n=1 Tax=Spirosoma sp. TaxID=1899569 RepID=UPI003B3B168F